MFFQNLNNINPDMISIRFRYIVKECKNLTELTEKLSLAVYNDIKQRSEMTDDELIEIYEKYNKENNIRKSSRRAVLKFREYCIQKNI